MDNGNNDEIPFAKEGFFAESAWDAIPIVLGVINFAFVTFLVIMFPILSWPKFLALALFYAMLIAWNMHSVSHNLIHNPYFSSTALNRAFSVLISLTLSYPQVIIRYVHLRHHIGNMDRRSDKGETRDLLSIYRHGRGDQPENVWTYCLLTPVRTDPFRLYPSVAASSRIEGRWAIAELVAIVFSLAIAVAWDWRAVPSLLPFWFLGHCLSSMTGYYEHLGADPKKPIAWGVSNYNKIYNWLWLNNGYHAEHHYRTKNHWTSMHALHQKIAEQQRLAGTKVLAWPHPLGFLDHLNKASG